MTGRWGGWRILALVLVLGLIVEGGAWVSLKLWYGFRPSSNPLVGKYMARQHPLLADNRDLRAMELGYRFDPFVSYRLLPNYVYNRVNPGFMSRIETDDAGFIHTGQRDRTARLQAEPRDKIYRIVVLGSSVVYGTGATNNENTIPAYIERILAERWPHVTFHVINAGVLSYQSTQERIYYELYVKDMRPDVLIHITGNVDAKLSSLLDKWEPHWNTAFLMVNDDYLNNFRFKASIRRFISSLLSFPEPLYSLAVLHKVMGAMSSVTDSVHRSDVRFHPEAVTQFATNVEGLARIADDDGTLAMFILQPHLGSKKAVLGAAEQALMESDGTYISMVGQYQAEFAAAFMRLDGQNKYKTTRFFDLSDAFDGVNDATYINMAHTNDKGNQVLAERIVQKILPNIYSDLKQKGFVGDGK